MADSDTITPRISADDTDHHVLSITKSDISVMTENVPGLTPTVEGIRGEYESFTVPIIVFSKRTLNCISETLGISEKAKNGTSKIFLTVAIGTHLCRIVVFSTVVSFVEGEKMMLSLSARCG